MVVKTKKLNKQRNKHRNKYTSTKSKVSRRTRKNDLVLRGGGDDVEIYYKKGFLNKIRASNSPNETIKEIQYKKLSEMPEIKINKNGRYKIMFYYKDYNNQSQEKSRYYSADNIFAECELERTGTLTHTVKTLVEKTDKLKNLLEKYASEYVQKALTITIKIYNADINKTTKAVTYQSNPNLTYYFNLKPIK